MTSLPQTRQHTFPAQDGRRRTTTPVLTGAWEPVSNIRSRPRQAIPAVDPSTAFGCVDWFLYPDQGPGHSAAESQSQRARA